MGTVMEREGEGTVLDSEIVSNGMADSEVQMKVGVDDRDGVEEDEEMTEDRKGRERRERREKRKEREVGGLAEDVETKEEKKKRRDEKERRRSKDGEEHERRDHRDGRDKKDVKRRKGKENKDRKDRREERDVIDKKDKADGDEEKNVEAREFSERRERKERKVERKDGLDHESHRKEIKDKDGGPEYGHKGSRSRGGTKNGSTGRNSVERNGSKDDLPVANYQKAPLFDDDKEEGEILDEDSGPAKAQESEMESGEIQARFEVTAGGSVEDVDASVQTLSGRGEGSRWDSPAPETISSPEDSMVDCAGGSVIKQERARAGKAAQDNTPSALQSMLGIAEAYDSESQASDEKIGFSSVRSESQQHSKKAENSGSRYVQRESDRKTQKVKALDIGESKKHLMGPPEQRSSDVKDKKVSTLEETRSRQDEMKGRSSLGGDGRSGSFTDREVSKEQADVDLSKGRNSRRTISPSREEQHVGKRPDGRRYRSPSPESLKSSIRGKHHRRGRSQSKDSDREGGRSRSLEGARGRDAIRKRSPSPPSTTDRSALRGRSPSREAARDRRFTGAEIHDRKKRSRSPEGSHERRLSRDNYEVLDRSRRSKSRDSGRLRLTARAESDDRRRRSRSRESLRDKRMSTDRDNGRRAESSERKHRSRSKESSHRREEREISKYADERRRRSRSRDSLRDRKVDDRDSSRHTWRVDDTFHKINRHSRDSRHYESSRDSIHRMERDKERNNMSSHDRERGYKASQSSKDSLLAENTREEENQEEYQERVASQLAAQEEDDIERIKEESRRRRQAILEKYKRQQQQKLPEDPVNTEIQDQNTSDDQVQLRQEQNGSAAAISGPAFDHDSSGTGLDLGKELTQNGALSLQTSERGGLGAGSPKSERSADMFCDDIFGESPAAGGRRLGKGDGLALDTSGLTDNWDDAEGYYCFRIGEVLDGRYEVASSHGRGVFSTVVRARDMKAGRGEPEEVAIKIIRNNETMFKAGQQELVILKKLAGADPENKRHCVRLLSSFEYRSHLCLVFESLHMNLREILKKFGRNIGINLNAVRAYAKQLFIALKHLRNCGVLHCDIKPDNMLVNESKNVLKLCDFGSAMFAGENKITPYLVSRFYRAPEIILGLPYDHALDIWSVGCCLYELYTGKMLFPGLTNNDMLRLHMELKGHFPKKMLKKAGFADQHFDQDFNFCAIEEDPVTKKTIKRILVNVRPKDMGVLVSSSGTVDEDSKMLASFKDLLEKIFILDPDKRLTVSQALNHSFISGK